MINDILTRIITSTFETEVGRSQVKRPVQEVLLIDFRTALDYDKEEGYRHLSMMIYAPMRYVQVWYNTSWRVIDRDHLDYDDKLDEEFIKPGCDYVTGKTEWVKISDHDSCWREGVERIVRGEFARLTHLDNLGMDKWYKVVQVPEFMKESA